MEGYQPFVPGRVLLSVWVDPDIEDGAASWEGEAVAELPEEPLAAADECSRLLQLLLPT